MGLSYIGLRSLLVSRGREWIAARHFVSVCSWPKLHSSSQRQGDRQDPVKGGVPHCHCCTMSPHSTQLLPLASLSTFASFLILYKFKLNSNCFPPLLLPMILSSDVPNPSAPPIMFSPNFSRLLPQIPSQLNLHVIRCPHLRPHFPTNQRMEETQKPLHRQAPSEDPHRRRSTTKIQCH